MLRKLLFAAALALAAAATALAQDPLEELLVAARGNDLERVRVMIERGMAPDTADRQGNTLLHIAAIEGHFDLAKYLLAQRARVRVRNAFGDSPLMLAALKGQLELVRLLAAHGGEINPSGWTPLHYCAWSGEADVCRLLLDLGAHVNALSANDTSPIMMAARQGHIETVQLLLERKPDLAVRNHSRATALSWARQYQQGEVARILENAGARE
jgi:ankyrin repeat protein